MILTLEEFCSEDDEFADDGGRSFADIFPAVRIVGLIKKLCLPQACVANLACASTSRTHQKQQREDRQLNV